MSSDTPLKPDEHKALPQTAEEEHANAMEVARKLFLKVEEVDQQDAPNDDLLESEEPRNDKSLDDDLLDEKEEEPQNGKTLLSDSKAPLPLTTPKLGMPTVQEEDLSDFARVRSARVKAGEAAGHSSVQSRLHQQSVMSAEDQEYLIAQKVEEIRRQLEYQRLYEELKVVFDRAGMSFLQTQMLKAFAQYLIEQTEGTKIERMGIIKHMALMCSQMMLREFEIIIWACLNSREQLDQEGVLGEANIQKAIFYRLLMTAFFLKEKFCKRDEFEAIKTYFNINFPIFLGKYTTEWLLLAEPDVSFITPRLLNQKFGELKEIYEKMTSAEAQLNEEEPELDDYNKLVEELGEEAQRVDQLRKQFLEKEEKQARAKKRLHQQMVEKRQKELEESQRKRLKLEQPVGSEQTLKDGAPSKSLNASFTNINVFNSSIYGVNAGPNARPGITGLSKGPSLPFGGDPAALLSFKSGIMDMHNLFNQLDMGNGAGGADPDHSFSFEPMRERSRMSLFNNASDIVNIMQRYDSKLGAGGLMIGGGMHHGQNPDLYSMLNRQSSIGGTASMVPERGNSHIYQPFRIPSRVGLSPLRKPTPTVGTAQQPRRDSKE
ncbi:hypothetical protein FGO68_gene10512 [Halteria grandinella]|uniref:Uncharacterized protein n=1 Tax=Halteria grandinella TaxID=5974 RepID=A0A8J8T6P1_HALGN|nr:hypothetical protein FGO68_gene10512 [Halteria grandinella]